jgi:uncharacterized protein (TIGR01777 family)
MHTLTILNLNYNFIFSLWRGTVALHGHPDHRDLARRAKAIQPAFLLRQQRVQDTRKDPFMPGTHIAFQSRMPVSASDSLAWHARPGAFERLSPPWATVRVIAAEGGIAPGASRTLRIGAGPAGFRWTLQHKALQAGQGFADDQIQGPFQSWNHEHHFIPESATQSILEDRLTYQLPLAPVSKVVAGSFVQRQLDELFRYRHAQTRHDLQCHARSGWTTPQRIAVTGASGLVGQALIHFLEAGGHEVYRLVRHRATSAHEIAWNPERSEIDAAALEAMDAVIHLAGTSIAGGRWTAARKASILQSRVVGTSLLARTLAGLRQPPRVLVSASAVGYYGDAPGMVLDESAPKGEGFLADVCEAWEDAAAPARDAGIRVVTPRLGVVLSGKGGMLALISRVVKLGIGGPLGSGNQMMSWISLNDLMGILLECMANDSLSGPVNAVAPEAVSNRTFTRTLAHVLRRPALFAVPSPIVRLVAGELGDELLLASQPARPGKLQEAGFSYSFDSLELTLRHELGHYDRQGGFDTSATQAMQPDARYQPELSEI